MVFDMTPTTKTRFTGPWSLARSALGLALVALLSACGSSVKLDEPPVSDRTGTPVPAEPAPAPTAPPAPPAPVKPVVVEEAKLAEPPASVARVVYFDYDSFVLKPEAMPVLEAHAKFLKAGNTRRVVLQGHTDERGTREYNLALGQKRAEAVRQALILMGVSDAQMEAVSFGKEKPAVLGSDEAAYAKNRRVELVYR